MPGYNNLGYGNSGYGYQNPQNAYYTPYSGYQTQLQQSQTISPAMNNQATNLLTVFVNSEAEVNDYPVGAGTTVQLISFPLGKFWIKSTATNGVPQPLRSFSFTEETAKEIRNEVVSRDEFNALSEKLDTLLKELGGDK